ncbi:hypothetical protein Z517_07695 [Fonsecaea pedrosoi CBS 271.37]|uniref:Xylanolytic transcriptional activator regulatory domain-containing protein n=1 Tax=Fonsecaea pedrosoi CBS 271.37 TaxID=1442368 RepID=A0A0D2EUE0_9EURO|nr:uncharacterized protein Z517_07695 [Fonsecaea pedrosoi CBS 271.37]KIW77862.1 hypothetical protein Z517_07695 [Fonsecaea pedrosoi CBS 271.37]
MPEDIACKHWMQSVLLGSDDANSRHGNALLLGEPWQSSTMIPEQLQSDDKTNQTSASDPLSSVAKEIVARLNSTIIHRAPKSPIRLKPSVTLDTCLSSFFSSRNIRRFIDLYWLTWYTHWPVVHRATFVYHDAPYTLVAAMVLIGATYSVDAEDRHWAKVFCDATEEMIFGDEYFGDSSPYSALNAACLNRRLRALQAAHAICLYQYWEGDERARRRVRKHRYGEVVAMAREFGFGNAMHGDLASLTLADFDWHEFALKEELIRTLNYIIVLDSGFVMMNNMPPRILPSELRVGLVCPEACFQASSKSDCFHHLRTWMSHPLWRDRRLATAEALNILTSGEMDSETVQFFTHLGYVNLGILIIAIHSVIFCIRTTVGLQHSGTSIQNWLRNWNCIWMLGSQGSTRQAFGTPSPSEQTGELSEGRWRGAGFMKDALQFWFLAQIMLRSAQDEKTDPQYTALSTLSNSQTEYDQASMAGLKALLKTQHVNRRKVTE